MKRRAYRTRRREAGIVPQQRTRIVDRAFALALAIKGIDGALELIGGLVLFVVPPSAISQIAKRRGVGDALAEGLDYPPLKAVQDTAGTDAGRACEVS